MTARACGICGHAAHGRVCGELAPVATGWPPSRVCPCSGGGFFFPMVSRALVAEDLRPIRPDEVVEFEVFVPFVLPPPTVWIVLPPGEAYPAGGAGKTAGSRKRGKHRGRGAR